MNYTVQRGDNLWTLARRHGIPLQELLRQVPESVRRDPRTLQPGMSLTLPGPDRTAPTTSQGPSQGASQGGMNRGYPDYMVPGRDVGGGLSTIPERDRSIPYPMGQNAQVQNTQAPSRLEQLYRESPEQAMKMLQGMPPTQMAAGIGRTAGALSRGNLVDRASAAVARPFEAAGDAIGKWRGDSAASRLERQHIDDALSGNMDRTPTQYEPLMQGQQRVQRLVDQGLGGDIPLTPDVGRMAQSNPNMSLESLHRFMSPGQPMPPNPQVQMIGRGQPMYGGQLRR